MNYQNKTKDELIKELQKLKQEFDSLKVSYEKDITGHKRIEEIIKKEKQELKLILDSSPIIIFYKDKKGKFIRVNKVFAEAIKLPEKEFVGKTVFDLYSDKIAQSMTNDDQKVLKSGRPELNIIEQYESESGIRWVQTDKIPICDKNGIPFGLIGFAQDITARKLTEEKLRESEERYRRLVEGSPEAIAVHSKGKFVFVNPAGAKLIGAGSPQELIGKPILDVVHPDSRSLVIERLRHVAEGKEAPLFEEKFVKFDGSVIDVEVVGIPFSYQGQIATQVVVRDITERKRTEENLRQKDQQQALILGSLPMAFYISRATDDLATTWISHQVETIVGFKSDNFLQDNMFWTSRLHPEDRDRILPKYSAVFKTGSAELVYRWQCADGSYRWFRDHLTLVRDGDGNPIEVVGIWIDITERKQEEEELALLAHTIRSISESVSVTDQENKILFVNDAFLKTYGYTLDELIGKSISIVRSTATEPSADDILRTTFQGGWQGELLNQKKDGTEFTIALSTSTVCNEKGQAIALVGIAIDITERKQIEELIKETTEQLHEAQKLACIGVWDWKSDTDIVTWTDELYSIAGLDPMLPAPTYKEHSNLYTPESWELLKTSVEKAMETGESYQLELELIRPNGDTRYVNAFGGAKYDSKGQVIGLFGTVQDITERKRAVKELKKTMSLMEATLESIHNGILVISLQRSVIRTNTRFAEMWRIPVDILNSGDDKRLLDYVIGQLIDPDAFIHKVEELYEKPEAESFDLIYFRDGRIFERISRPMYLGSEPKGRVWSFLDISESKRAEEAVHLEKDNFRRSLDDSPLGVRIVTTEGDTIYANQTILDFYGYDSLGELQKTPLKDRYTPESYDQAQKRKSQREHGDLSATKYEVSIVRKNGEIRHLQVFRKEVLWDGIRQFQILYDDITERKLAEDEIIKSKKLLEDLHKHLNEMRENERTAISREIHDQIGQSLTALKLDLNQMFKHINANPEAVTKLESMVELISDTIKDVQRISSDLRPGILDDLGLAAAIEWYSGEFEKRTAIKCSLNLDDSIFGDPRKNLVFFRVLQEALTNVIRHANASSVTIKLHHTLKGTTLIIQDDGIGITREKIESVKSLGLIGMRERVKQFGGKIDFSSKEDHGTKLTIFIPEGKKSVL